MKTSISRRDLFKFGGVAAIGAAGAASLAGCAPKHTSEDEKETKAASSGSISDRMRDASFSFRPPMSASWMS